MEMNSNTVMQHKNSKTQWSDWLNPPPQTKRRKEKKNSIKSLDSSEDIYLLNSGKDHILFSSQQERECGFVHVPSSSPYVHVLMCAATGDIDHGISYRRARPRSPGKNFQFVCYQEIDLETKYETTVRYGL